MVVKAVFLDRDGVINRKPPEGDYIKTWDEFVFLPKVDEAVRILSENLFKVIIVTNQRGIVLHLMTENDVEDIHRRMVLELERRGAHIERIYYCPHEKNSCTCRKPDIGMFLKARADFPGLSFPDSFVIGDSTSDMEAGKKLSCRCVLITEKSGEIPGDAWYRSAGSLYEAVTQYVVPGGG